jgi:hypothetical protein
MITTLHSDQCDHYSSDHPRCTPAGRARRVWTSEDLAVLVARAVDLARRRGRRERAPELHARLQYAKFSWGIRIRVQTRYGRRGVALATHQRTASIRSAGHTLCEVVVIYFVRL